MLLLRPIVVKNLIYKVTAELVPVNSQVIPDACRSRELAGAVKDDMQKEALLSNC
jgi:hypothetical protein